MASNYGFNREQVAPQIDFELEKGDEVLPFLTQKGHLIFSNILIKYMFQKGDVKFPAGRLREQFEHHLTRERVESLLNQRLTDC
jgi:hypothetical protein